MHHPSDLFQILDIDKDIPKMDQYPLGFEEDHRLRSSFIRDITLQQLERPATSSNVELTQSALIPRWLVFFVDEPAAALT